MKYILKAKLDTGYVKICFEATELDEVLLKFKEFLLACGFVFDSASRLDLVNDNEI